MMPRCDIERTIASALPTTTLSGCVGDPYYNGK